MTPKEAFARLVEAIDVYDESIGMTSDEMMEIGMRPFAREEVDGVETDKDLWPFPLSYYEHIPAGFPIVDLFFHKKVFQPHVTKRDVAYGLLSYGVLGRTKASLGK